MQWFVERYVHFKEIASRWWIVVVGLWSAFWAIDSMMTKWASPTLKATWDENTSHVPRGWQYWLIGLLVITIILVLDGSFRHAKRFDASNVLEEHDPKVYFEPVNSDFIPTGMIPFDMFNNGQRVNPAHRITVQPIALLPSVTFEYVNHLEMNQHKKLLPQVKHGPDSLLDSHNILPALETAWLSQNADHAHGEL